MATLALQIGHGASGIPNLLTDPSSRILTEAVVKWSHRQGSLLVGMVKQKITDMRKVDRGDLRKSISYNVRVVGSRVEMELGSNLDHALWVHEGTKPHFPPIAPLISWVHRKNPGMNPVEVAQVARFVQLKIGFKGTDANPFFTEVLDEQSKKVSTKFNKEVLKTFRDELDVK